MPPDASSPRTLRTVGDEDPIVLLNTFLDVSLSLTQQFDIQHILISMVERSMSLTSARYGAAVLVGPDGKVTQFLHRGLTPEQVTRIRERPAGRGLLGSVLEDGKAVRLANLAGRARAVTSPEQVVADSFLGVPMHFRTRLVGALYLAKPPGEPPFDTLDEALMKALASMGALGVENARLFASETQRAWRNDVLRAISDVIHASLDHDAVLSSTAEQLGIAVRSDRCVIRLADPATGELRDDAPYQWNAADLDPLPGGSLEPFPVTRLAASTSQTQWSRDMRADGSLPEEPTAPVGGRACLATPLVWNGALLGVASCYGRKPREWTADDIALIEEAAAIVAGGLHHIWLVEKAVQTATRLQDVDQQRSDFVAMVAHEVRSPATAIAGIAGELRKPGEVPSEKRNELLDTLERESRRLARLVSAVLDVEAIDQGVLELDTSEVDLARLAHEAIVDAGSLEDTRLVVEPGAAQVPADRDKIKQVLINLINNALRFSPPGDAVTVAVTPRSDAVTVSVTDRGPGIPPEHRDKMFARFGTVPATAKHGSGLGLYLSRRLIDAHHGSIWFESEPGATTFFFDLPRRVPGGRSG